MKMKKIVLLSVLLGALPITMMAQDDDLYFNPKSERQESVSHAKRVVQGQPTYYCGSNRGVDEYNRRGRFSSQYQTLGKDSLNNDVIDFQAGRGVYPDSTYVDSTFTYTGPSGYDGQDDDYYYSRRMGLWDGYYNPWIYGGYSPWYSGWYDPWYSGWGGYYGWGNYYGWYDPWYYGWGGYYNGWYNPWYYGYGWGYPYYGGYAYGWGFGGNGHRVGYNVSGARPGEPTRYFNGTSGGSRAYAGSGYSSRSYGNTSTGSINSNRFGGLRNSSTSSNRGNYNYSVGSRSTSETRSYTPSYNSSSSFGGSRSVSSGGGFSGGGGHSGGGFSGGGGGGGHFGGHR
jgi:hypothetical protein